MAGEKSDAEMAEQPAGAGAERKEDRPENTTGDPEKAETQLQQEVGQQLTADSDDRKGKTAATEADEDRPQQSASGHPHRPGSPSRSAASSVLSASSSDAASEEQLEVESIHNMGKDNDLEKGISRVTSTGGANNGGGNNIHHVTTNNLNDAASAHLSSLGPDTPAQPWSSYVEIPDEFYDRFKPRRKLAIVAWLSYCSFLAPISSTAVLAAIPEVAAEFNTTGSIVGISNALYMLFMGISPMVWGPMSEVYGRRWINLSTGFLFFCCSIGTALAPNLPAYFIFRILTAFEGTAFILVGSASVSDIYRPTERATAMGWFLSGTLVGPALGPFIGGIIVTYQSWRVIFWLQVALSGLALVGSALMLPETIHHRKMDDLAGYPARNKVRVLWGMINPVRVIRLYIYPNLVMAGLASSALIWNMYSLLTPIRYVLNPRFGLTTPMESGLFYLAPGCGYLVGTFMGGRYADYIVRQWMAKRGGERVPEDRLRSALPFMGIAIPGCMFIYGWCVEKGKGGIPLVVVVLFLQGVAQLFCFPSLNTYCLDVMQSRGSDVIAGNYVVRYLFACAGTAVVLPAVEAIGVGWFSTISALFLVLCTLALYSAVIWGRQWRDRTDRWRDRRRKAAYLRARARLNRIGAM